MSKSDADNVESCVQYYNMQMSIIEGNIDTSSPQAQSFLTEAFPMAGNITSPLAGNDTPDIS